MLRESAFQRRKQSACVLSGLMEAMVLICRGLQQNVGENLFQGEKAGVRPVGILALGGHVDEGGFTTG